MHWRVYKGWGKETRDWWNIYIQETDKETPLSWLQYTEPKWGPDLRGNRPTNLSPCKRAARAEEWLTTPTKLSLGSKSEREDQRGWWREPRWEDTQKSQAVLENRDEGKPEEAEVDAKGWEENKERMAVRAEAVEGEVASLWHQKTPAFTWRESSHGSHTAPWHWHAGAWISVSFQLMGCMATPLSSDCEVKIPIHSYTHTYPCTNLSFLVW